MKKRLYLPCLRGELGDWTYYSCIMKLKDVSERIDYAKIIHKSENLSELIQRELDEGRGIKIKEYLLTNKERFFNSMIVAVYGGDPEWLDLGNPTSRIRKEEIKNIPSKVFYSLGILSFSGEEKLFALDGQHRLSGIKQVNKECKKLDDEEISIIFVAHRNTKQGLERSRRLFTTLNKNAKPVTKGETIALDEDDTMAIISRRLVDNYELFNNKKIAVNATNNIPVNNIYCLTTIGNLYDLLQIMYSKIIYNKTHDELTLNRLDEKSLSAIYDDTVNLFDNLCQAFTCLNDLKISKDSSVVVNKYRTNDGGVILYRPVGLSLLFELIATLSKKHSLEDVLKIIYSIPLEFNEEPYRWVIWNPVKNTIINGGKGLATRMLLYMLNENITKRAENKLLEDYAKALGKEVIEVTLPRKLSV